MKKLPLLAVLALGLAGCMGPSTSSTTQLVSCYNTGYDTKCVKTGTGLEATLDVDSNGTQDTLMCATEQGGDPTSQSSADGISASDNDTSQSSDAGGATTDGDGISDEDASGESESMSGDGDGCGEDSDSADSTSTEVGASDSGDGSDSDGDGDGVSDSEDCDCVDPDGDGTPPAADPTTTNPT